MTVQNYCVKLDLFEGPIDLLLYLIRKNELSILDLQVSMITSQFQEFLEVLEVLDLDQIGDFVVMASTLIEIKSRDVLPRSDEELPDDVELDADDPKSNLIEQLLEYKKFKDATNALEERSAEWLDRYPRLVSERPTAGRNHSADFIKEVELWDLVSAFSRVLQATQIEQHATIDYDTTPIHIYVEQLGERIREEQEVAFFTLFDDETERSKIVGMFLAVLELVRHHGFSAQQDADFGEIWLRPPKSDSVESE